MYKIGIISDTHGLLREEVIKELESCQLILHAGDINKLEVIQQLEAIAPLKVVRGNNDKGEWAEQLPESLMFTVAGKRFFMVHNKKDVLKDRIGIDVIVYGHSHKYYYAFEEGVHILNPGSCGKRRFDQAITIAIMTIEEEKIEVKQIEIAHS